MKKLIKKLVLKYLSKYVGKEFTQMDNRIYDIEVKLGIKKSEHDAGSKYVGDMAVKDAEHLKGAKEPHFLELPELWCVKDCEEVSEWASKKFYCIDLVSDDYFHFGKTKHNNKNYAFLSFIEEGYTEISFSDFERLVLKKEEAAKIDKLESGRWYKNKLHTCLACYSTMLSGYGFLYGNWFGSISMTHESNWEPATNKEARTALIEEAKTRYPLGSTVISKSLAYKTTLNTYDLLTFSGGDLYAYEIGNPDNILLFHDGIWAEIIDQPKEVQEIDFSVPGQIVQGYDDGLPILMTTGSHNVRKNTFQAVTLKPRPDSITNDFEGEHWQRWNKDNFKLYNEELILKN